MNDLRERVARAIHDVWRHLNSAEDDIADYAVWEDIEDWERKQILAEADAAIALVLEEAAKVAEDCAPVSQDTFSMELAERCDMVAAAIRALKEFE